MREPGIRESAEYENDNEDDTRASTLVRSRQGDHPCFP